MTNLDEPRLDGHPALLDVGHISRRQLKDRRRHFLRRDVIRRHRRLPAGAPIFAAAVPAPGIGRVELLTQVVPERLKGSTGV